MNKYVVAFWSDHTGELKQEFVEAKSMLEAACSYLDIPIAEFPSMDSVYQYAVNSDSMINVIEVTDRNWKRYSVMGPGSISTYVSQ